ncbi:MAG TPA: Ig-like domain-containing protein [Propionicimonas sp.]
MLVAAVVLAAGPVAEWGCGGSSAPGSPSGPSPSIPVVSSVTVTSTGTVSPNVGISVQLKATVSFSNGSTQDVTTLATWRSSNVAVATVSATGLLSAVAAGQADITAVYQAVTGTWHITVTPAPPANIAGAYTATFTASSSCSQIPANLRVRSYNATVTQSGSAFAFQLTTGSFLSQQGLGTVNGNTIAVAFGLAEDLGSAGILMIGGGTYDGLVQGQNFSFTSNGYYEYLGYLGTPDLRCNAADNRVSFVRR